MNRFLRCLVLLLLVACKPSPKVLWKFQTGAPIYGSPSLWRDSLIIGSNDHFLYSLDLSTGAILWKKNMGERILSRPLIQDNVIYVGTGSGNFFALDPADGKERWRFRTGAIIQYDACDDQDSIYFGSYDRNFYKISKKDGSKQWSYQSPRWYTGNCAIYKNLVLTSAWDGFDYAFDRSTGAVVWKFASGNFNYGGPQLSGDRVYFATHDNLYILDAASGRKIYQRKTGYLRDTLISHEFLWTYDDGLSKRNLDGEKLARLPLSYTSETQPVAGNGFVIVSVRKELYGVSDDMKIRWKWEGGESFWAPGVIYNNVYYTGNRDSNVYAFRLPQ
jgi:outer membrane protein assembly factor BamB